MRRLLAVTFVLAAGCFLLPFSGLGQDRAAKPKRTEFAADRTTQTQSDKAILFDNQRAHEHLDAIRALGARTSGSEAMRCQQDMLQKHFEDLGARVVFQPFAHQKGVRPSALSNMVVSWHPERDRRILLCTHYDSRPKPPAPPREISLREQAFPGFSKKSGGRRDRSESAGESEVGVALLMELGMYMHQLKPKLGVDFLFLDGRFSDSKGALPPDTAPRYSRGIEHFLKSRWESRSRPRYAAAVLLDLRATAAAPFLIEGNSWLRARLVAQEIWSLANELHVPAFAARVGERVTDDHLPLIQAGMAAVDITTQASGDRHLLPNNVPMETMPQVGHVLGGWLQRKER